VEAELRRRQTGGEEPGFASRNPRAAEPSTTARLSSSSSLDKAVQRKIEELRLPPDFATTVRTACRKMAEHLLRMEDQRRAPHVIGLCGCQGSGKSTLAAFLKLLLDGHGRPTAILSLDDLYLTRRERERLAREVHPLLRTRGVPGTHDVALGLKTLNALRRAGAKSRVALPRFDKARDDRAPRKQWDVFRGPAAFILFEGWCVDARPQPAAALRKSVNRLERKCDPDETWRRYVNDQLAGPYRELFAPIDELLFMQAPSFDCVYKWRGLQEKKLREASRRGTKHGMDRTELAAFIMHYERLTRWMLKEMPPRADILLPLGPDQRIRAVRIRAGGRGSSG